MVFSNNSIERIICSTLYLYTLLYISLIITSSPDFPSGLCKGPVTIEIILIASKIYFTLSVLLSPPSLKHHLLKQTNKKGMDGQIFYNTRDENVLTSHIIFSLIFPFFRPGNLDCFNSCFYFSSVQGEINQKTHQ